MAFLTYISAITEALREEMQRDERVFLIGEDLGKKARTGSATKGLEKEFGAERVISSPVAEDVNVSAAVGAAIAGLRPVSEIRLADSLSSSMEALTQQAAKLRYRSAGTQTCPLTIRVSYGGGINGGLYNSQTNSSWLAHQPGLVVVAPATVMDAKGMLKAAIRQDDPVVYFEHKKLYRSIKEDLPDDPDLITDLLKASVRREGKDLTVVSYGYTLHLALEAAEKVSSMTGATIEVIDLRILNPLDKDTVLESISKTGRLCIVHEDNRTLGIGAEIAAIASEQAFDCLDAPIARVTAPDVPAMPFASAMEQFYLPSVGTIAEAYKKLLDY